jgi:hypothetical protein
MFKNKTAYSLASVISFIIVIIVVGFHGNNSRTFASGTATFTVDAPEKAFGIWEGKKVRGRILLLFDSYPYMLGLDSYQGIPQLTQWNLIEFSVFQNIIRKIYLIVPDNDWEKFHKNKVIMPIRQVGNSERELLLFSSSGILFIATTPSSLPHISEETLVLINRQIFDYEQTLELLSRKKIAGDIIISYEGHGG